MGKHDRRNSEKMKRKKSQVKKKARDKRQRAPKKPGLAATAKKTARKTPAAAASPS